MTVQSQKGPSGNILFYKSYMVNIISIRNINHIRIICDFSDPCSRHVALGGQRRIEQLHGSLHCRGGAAGRSRSEKGAVCPLTP